MVAGYNIFRGRQEAKRDSLSQTGNEAHVVICGEAVWAAAGGVRIGVKRSQRKATQRNAVPMWNSGALLCTTLRKRNETASTKRAKPFSAFGLSVTNGDINHISVAHRKLYVAPSKHAHQ